MKKTYMTPIVNTEMAESANIICVSIKGDSSTGLEGGGGSDGEAHAPESDWNIWGNE